MEATVSLLMALSKYLGKYEYTDNSRAAQYVLPDQQYKFQIFQRYYDSLPDCFFTNTQYQFYYRYLNTSFLIHAKAKFTPDTLFLVGS